MTISPEAYGSYETAWCPGCGNHAILDCLKTALSGMGLEPHQVGLVSGIGQAAKTPQYINCNMFNGLHGRSLPAAQGAKMANPDLNVIVTSGDGCVYGEGGNHFMAALRRNVDMTLFVHDNQIYGLTKGQASPTTAKGQKTKAQPVGAPSEPFNPIAAAVAMKAAFVARAYSGDKEHLIDMMTQAVQFRGFAMVDILQPCVSFNKINTYAWYQQRCYKLDDSHDPENWAAAMALADEFGDRIPLGVIYRNPKPVFGDADPLKPTAPLATQELDKKKLADILDSFA